jgi:hypothetical protein
VEQDRRHHTSFSPQSRLQGQALMPSLFKYFTIVGAVLLGLLMLANSVLEPDGPKPRVVTVTPKVNVKHDPGASLVERLRNEEQAREAAKRQPLASSVSFEEQVISATQRDEPGAPARADPVQVSALAAVTTAASSEDANARSARLARKKGVRERQQRLARERARAVQQVQTYYGYAPQPTYGPFSGWGQAQRW